MSQNKYRGEVQIELDKPRTLRIDFNALVAAEEKIGGKLDLGDIMAGGFKAVRALIWAGLVAEDPSLTEQQLGAMIGPPDFQRLAEAIVQSISGGNLPDKEDESKNVQGTAGA